MFGMNYVPLTFAQIIAVLNTQNLANLSTMSCTQIETVPMWYIFDVIGNTVVFYMVFVNNGVSMTNMKANGIVCVELLTQCSQSYTSIVANGVASPVCDPCLQTSIKNRFLAKYAGVNCFQSYFCNPNLQFVRIDVNEITGRLYNF